MRIRGFNEKKQEWVIIEITDGGAMVGLENCYDIASCSVGVSTEKADMRGKEVFQGDIILSYSTDIEMEIKYGCYQSYCPEDKCVMNNIGFYAVGETLKDMPIGPLDEYAIVIANTYGK